MSFLSLNPCRNASVCATKLLCFTRSSPLIHKLPTDFPSKIVIESGEGYEQFLRDNLFNNLDQLTLCKVNCGHSQSQLEKLLQRFTKSRSTLLVLIVNMQELSTKMINHLRIMIEEAEKESTHGKRKLFILLLHFPSVMFYNSCYPTLFLQGWDHHYLDTIGRGTLTREGIKAVVDIKYWFSQCCFEKSSTRELNDQMVETLERMLPEAIPVVASRVVIHRRSANRQAYQLMNAYERTRTLQRIFKDKTGKILCTRFCGYWKKDVMTELMHRVTRFMYSNESTLNITDSIQTAVRSHFFDFLIYIVSTMNVDHDIDFLLQDHQGEVQVLFWKLLETVPIPKLTQLQLLRSAIQPEQKRAESTYSPSFPFFKHVCKIIEKVIDESKEYVNQQTNMLQDGDDQYEQAFADVTASVRQVQRRTRQNKHEELYTDLVMRKLQDDLKVCLFSISNNSNTSG